MKKLQFLILSLIVLNTINAYAINKNTKSDDSLIFKNEISIDISSVFNEFLRGGGISMYGNKDWTQVGLSYKIRNKKNNAIGIDLTYKFIYGTEPLKLVEVNDTSKTFLSVSHRKNNLELNISYEFRKKIKKIEFFYGISLYGYKNHNNSSISDYYYYGNDYYMYQLNQLAIDSICSDELLSSVSYRVGISLNTGIRFPISNHLSFITSLGLPLFYEFGEAIIFDIYSNKLKKSSLNYFGFADAFRGKISIAYTF